MWGLSKVLVTGGAGFIGFNLAKKLAGDNEVTIWDNLSRGKMDDELKALTEQPNIDFVQIDLTKPEEYTKNNDDFDHVYHLAAINGTKYFYEKPELVLRTNLLSTIYMLDWFKEKKGKILFSSSSETYASTVTNFNGKIPSPEEIPLSIDNVFNPRWSYGGSKIAGELLFANYGKKYGFDFSIIRYHNIYGPRMGYEHVIPEFNLRLLQKEDPFKIFGGKAKRAFCFIDDAIEATIKVMETKKTNNQIVHIGDSREEISIQDLAEKLFKVAGETPSLKIEEEVKGSVQRRCPDTSKLKNLTGFEAKVSLEQGLKQTWDWYKKDFEEKQ